MNKSTTGVVILNYNSHDLTVALANKVSNYPSVDYICVVDNCSSDVFFESEFASEKIHFIKSSSNGGYSAGNNIGFHYLIEDCECDYVFVANPDVLFLNDAISCIEDFFNSHPTTALVATRRVGYEGAKIHQWFDFPTILDAIKTCFFISRRSFEDMRREVQNKRVNSEDFIKVDAVPGAFFGIRSNFLVENGYMTEEIFMYGEELILGKQAQIAGYDAYILCGSEYAHNHKTIRLAGVKAFVNDHRSCELFFKKFGIGTPLGRGILHVCTVFGCVEYKLACSLANLIRRDI